MDHLHGAPRALSYADALQAVAARRGWDACTDGDAIEVRRVEADAYAMAATMTAD